KCNIDEELITTSLIEGSVRYKELQGGQEVILKPSEQLQHNKRTKEFNFIQMVKIEDSRAWIDGKLIFEHASLEEIARSLEKHYNVHITFRDEEAKELRFNGEFDMNDNIFQILSVLQMTNTFKHEIE